MKTKLTPAQIKALNSGKAKIRAQFLKVVEEKSKAKALKAERGKGKQIDDPRYKEL